ncbi:hypothetical protein ABZP36_032901 [Zizania latifolia]
MIHLDELYESCWCLSFTTYFLNGVAKVCGNQLDDINLTIDDVHYYVNHAAQSTTLGNGVSNSNSQTGMFVYSFYFLFQIIKLFFFSGCSCRKMISHTPMDWKLQVN